MKTLNRFILSAILFISIFLGVQFIWSPRYFRVYGPSMWPNICNGDRCIGIGKFNSIKRGEVVGFYYNGNTLVKRVIGLPGEEINIIDGRVFINGRLEDTIESVFDFTPTNKKVFNIKLGLDEYFVLGDNRPHSYDSRIIGPINRELILYKIIARWGSLNPRTFYEY